jgi:hypothetical protein
MRDCQVITDIIKRGGGGGETPNTPARRSAPHGRRRRWGLPSRISPSRSAAVVEKMLLLMPNIPQIPLMPTRQIRQYRRSGGWPYGGVV